MPPRKPATAKPAVTATTGFTGPEAQFSAFDDQILGQARQTAAKPAPAQAPTGREQEAMDLDL